jgi:hypothetical protein
MVTKDRRSVDSSDNMVELAAAISDLCDSLSSLSAKGECCVMDLSTGWAGVSVIELC